jgi:hypothetical protein
VLSGLPLRFSQYRAEISTEPEGKRQEFGTSNVYIFYGYE